MLGARHLRTLTVTAFPNVSRPGILDALNEADFPYRWVTRFIALDKTDATKLLTKIRRQWFNKRKSITAMLREVMYNQPTQLLDSDADNKVVDADMALQALGGDHVAFGFLTATITVSDDDRETVEARIRQVERITGGLGFTTIREGVNAVEAWLSSLPGHAYANVRQPIVHTLNLAHLMPLSSIAEPAQRCVDGVFRHALLWRSKRRKEESSVSGQSAKLLQFVQHLAREWHPMRPPHLHLFRR
jgi:type IV secretion system protein VirB4